MIQLIVSAALAIIFFLLFWKTGDEFLAAGAFTGFLCVGIWFVTCLIMWGC